MTDNLKFYYKTDNQTDDKNIINTKECIENISNTKYYQGYIDYRFALENITLFEKLVTENIKAKITIIKLHDEILDTYKNIFDFIASGGNLVYHYGGIMKKHKPVTEKKLAMKRELLKDIRHRRHGCIIGNLPNYEIEKEICSIMRV